MKLYCKSCGILTAEIVTGSTIRKDALMICKQCYDRFKIADDMAKMAQTQTKNEMPEFFKDLFGGVKK